MLYRLSNILNEDNKRILNNTNFILHDITKKDVKKIAQDLNLPSKDTKESQNICFIPDDDYPRYISQNYPFKYNP
jgi:tRNA-specific 2-thiouridylase